MNTRQPRARVLTTAVALLGLFGCNALSPSSRRDDESGGSRRRSEPRYEDRSGDRYDDRSRDRYEDTRRNPSGPGDTWYDDKRYDRDDAYERDTRERGGQRADANVPRGASQAAVGEGTVSYRPTTDGRVWVTESEFDKVIWSGKVYQGEAIEVVPKRDRVFVDRREVAKTPMKDDIRYRIFFDRDRY
jgi:hypothetical protein